jgi:Skp family chaperone for outer membrane proteins
MKIKNALSVLFIAATAAGVCLPASASDSSANSGRSPEFQRRVDREQAAEDLRDRNSRIQEQQNKEERELKRLRAERAEQRNARRQAEREAEAQRQAEARNN